MNSFKRAGILSSSVLLFSLSTIAAADNTADNTLLSLPDSVSTGTAVETEKENIGRSVDVRTQDELEQQNNYSLTDALQNVAGVRTVDIGGSGGPGLTPLEIRGFQTRGSQLLINGMTLADPSSVSGTFDNYFGDVSTFDLSSIEVVKGGAGVLYGSDAQAGAVNLVLKRPQEGYHTNFVFETGSFDRYLEGGSVNYGAERAGLVLSASRLDSNGLDTHSQYANTNVTAVGDIVLLPEQYLTVTPIFRFINTHRDIDTNPSVDEEGNLTPNQDTPRNFSDTQAYFIGTTVKATPSDLLELKSDVYYTNTARKFYFDFDGFESQSIFDGTALNADGQVTFNLSELNSRVSLGGEYERQGTDTNSGGVTNSSSRDQLGAYLFDQTHLFEDSIQVGTGVRVSHISDIDKTLATLEGSTAIKVPWTGSRVHSSIAQGFRAPTLFESKGEDINFDTGELTRVGNPNLNEEESVSWDVGVEHPIVPEKLSADVTYFQINAHETILFDFENERHINGGPQKTAGFETSLLAQPWTWAYLRGAFTHLETAEDLDDERRQRTPRDWFAITAAARYDQLTVSSELRYRSSQDIEFFGVADRYQEDGVTVLDASATYAVCPHADIFVRADNIFDARYTEAGFSMPRASVWGGFRVKM